AGALRRALVVSHTAPMTGLRLYGSDQVEDLPGGTLAVDAFSAQRHDLAVDGNGVAFTPSLFCDHAVTVVDLALPPRIRYPARGLATVWHTDTTTPPTALADLLGRTRTRTRSSATSPSRPAPPNWPSGWESLPAR
ncbi:hypothetical protein ACFWHX_32990, partial [Streptomyces hirsutus]